MSSKLDARAFEGLLRVIEFYLPAGGPFPPVRKCVAAEDARVAIDAVPPGDRGALLLVLRVFRWIPRWATGLPLTMVRWLGGLPGNAGAPFRLLRLGLEGLAYTLYFSAPGPLSVLRWDADVRSPEGAP